jgi:hypothetical protein
MVYPMVIRNLLRPFGIFYGHLIIQLKFWNIFPRFGILKKEKSGNPGRELKRMKINLGSRRVLQKSYFGNIDLLIAQKNGRGNRLIEHHSKKFCRIVATGEIWNIFFLEEQKHHADFYFY